MTVPWAMPVGTALSPAARARSMTASGRASVAMSMSATGRPRRALRTQPPTGSAWWPAAVSAPQTAWVAGACNQGASMRVTG